MDTIAVQVHADEDGEPPPELLAKAKIWEKRMNAIVFPFLWMVLLVQAGCVSDISSTRDENVHRKVKAWRTLVAGIRLKVAQVPVPKRVFPEEIFQFDETTQPAFVRLSPGEYEDIQFAVEFEDPADVMQLEVSMSPFQEKNGNGVIKAQLKEALYLVPDKPSRFSGFIIGKWPRPIKPPPRRWPPQNSSGFPVGHWPDPLFDLGWERQIPEARIVKRNIEVLIKSRKRIFWLIVHAPRDARPGTYSGIVKLLLGGSEFGKFPVEIKVNSFILPERPSLRCSTGMVGWKGNRPSNWKILGLPDRKVEEITRNAMDSYRRLLLEYGWTPTMWFGDVGTWKKYRNVGRGVSVFPSGKSKENEEWLIKNGLLKYAFIYAPFDEHSDGKVPEVVEWARKWKSESRIPILDCYYGGNVKPLFGLVDVWLGQDPRQCWARKRQKAGDRFFSCNTTLIWFVEFAPEIGRAQFWDDFTSGANGRYVYSTCRWTDDVYKKNWTGGNYLGCVVYPGQNGITTSIRLETLRDAVEDYDYLTILRDKVAKAEAAGKAPADAVKQAHELVDDPKLARRVQTPEALAATRNTIADLIEKLNGSGR